MTARTLPVVLIVEDDRSILYLLSRLVRGYGWESVQAETVAAALAALGSAPDLVLLDLMLPDGDGTEVLKAVRRDGLACPVVVSTALSFADVADKLGPLAPELVLQKPIPWLKLEEFMDAARERWHARGPTP